MENADFLLFQGLFPATNFNRQLSSSCRLLGDSSIPCYSHTTSLLMIRQKSTNEFTTHPGVVFINIIILLNWSITLSGFSGIYWEKPTFCLREIIVCTKTNYAKKDNCKGVSFGKQKVDSK